MTNSEGVIVLTNIRLIHVILGHWMWKLAEGGSLVQTIKLAEEYLFVLTRTSDIFVGKRLKFYL